MISVTIVTNCTAWLTQIMALALPLLSVASSCLFNKQSSRPKEKEEQGKKERREWGIDGGWGEWKCCGRDLTFTHLTIQIVIFFHQRLSLRCIRNIIFSQELSFTEGFPLLSSLPPFISNSGYSVHVCVCVCFPEKATTCCVRRVEWKLYFTGKWAVHPCDPGLRVSFQQKFVMESLGLPFI